VSHKHYYQGKTLLKMSVDQVKLFLIKLIMLSDDDLIDNNISYGNLKEIKESVLSKQ